MSARTPTKTDKIIGERVRLARKLAKFSQTTLGLAVGVTYQQVQKYENGTDRIGAGRLYQVARATEQPITFFFDDNVVHSNAIGVSGALLADPRIEKLLVAVAKVENNRLLSDLVRIAETFVETEAAE